MNKQNERLKEKILEDLEWYKKYRVDVIEAHEASLKKLGGAIEVLKEEIKSIEDSMNTLDNKMTVIEEEIKWLKDNGYARLDGRVAKAIKHRKLTTLIGMKKRPTKLAVSSTRVYYEKQYWCKAWFTDVSKAIPSHKRKKFYETLQELKDDKEELERQVGLWLLNAMS